MVPETVAVIALLVCLATAVQGTLGFGFAIVFAPLAALVVNVDTAIATSIVVGAFASLSQYAQSRPRAGIATIAPMVLGALAGLPLGLALLAGTDETTLRLLVGVGVLVSALLTLARRSAPRPRTEERLPWMLGAGMISGVTLGAVSMNGPPVLLYLHWTGGFASEIRARMIAFLAFSSLPGVIIGTAFGLIDSDVVVLVLAGIPGIAAGLWMGRRLRHRLSEEQFAVASMSVLAIASVVAIGGAVSALL